MSIATIKNKTINLPEVFDSAQHAVSILKLDRRHKWYVLDDKLVYDYRYTAPNSCTGCDGGGCHECGYTGKRVSYVPIPASMPDGSMVKIKTNTI